MLIFIRSLFFYIFFYFWTFFIGFFSFPVFLPRTLFNLIIKKAATIIKNSRSDEKKLFINVKNQVLKKRIFRNLQNPKKDNLVKVKQEKEPQRAKLVKT